MVRKILISLATVLGVFTVLAVGAVAWLYVTSDIAFTVPATTEGDTTLPSITIDGYRFHGETFGEASKPVAIVLHGGPGGDYRSILPLKALADEYFVVFYDQRGAGLSPRREASELTLERYVDDLDRIIDRFSPQRPAILIGHSWGAMLAAAYVGRYPDRVSAAVLAEPGFFDQDGLDHFNEMTGFSGGGPSWTVMASMSGAWGESLHVDGPDPYAAEDYLMGRFLTLPMDNHPMSGYYRDGDIRNAAGAFWRFGARASRAVQKSGTDDDGRLIDLAAGVESFRGPVLFMTGSENTIIGEERQRIHMRRFQDARLVVIDGAGHTMIGEEPEASVAEIRSFLSAAGNGKTW